MTPRVLVIDDERPFVGALAISLRARGYDVDTAATGEDGLAAAAKAHPDVIVLDLGLPGIDGLDVLRALRGWTTTPIVVLSARHSEASKVEALDAGADDYVTKPFGMDEFLARLRAALRRGGPADDQAVIETDHFTIDLAAKEVTGPDGPIRLTPTEWNVLDVLARNVGKLVSQRQLLQEAWGPQYEKETDYLRVYMAALRRKLEPEPSRPRYLLTEPGMGYRLKA